MLRHSSDPRLVYELVPGDYVSDGYFLRSDVVEYTVDENGCRITPGVPSGGNTKLLFLGSSIVFGIAVDAESAMPEAARRALHERSPPVEITPENCAVPGYSLLQTLHHAEIAVAEQGVQKLAIVVGPKHGSVPYDWTRTAPSSGVVRWLSAHVRLVRLAYLFYLVRQTSGFRLPPAPPDELRAGLDRLSAALRDKGARATVFIVGEMEHPDFDLPAELDRRGLSRVMIQPPPHDKQHVHSDGDHWSPEGVRFIVDQMAPGLVDLAGVRTANR